MTIATPTMTLAEEEQWGADVKAGKFRRRVRRPNPPVTGRSNAIAEELHRRYPCGEAPRGAWTEIGEQFGVSRERVRQIALKAGVIRKNKTRHERVCLCGRPITTRNARYCEACRFLPVACASCGKVSKRARHVVIRTANNPLYTTGLSFCNRVCFGKYSGQHYGTASANHPYQRMASGHRTRVLQSLRAYMAEHGTMPLSWPEFDEVTGIRNSRSVLNRLRANGLAEWEPYKPWTLRIHDGAVGA